MKKQSHSFAAVEILEKYWNYSHFRPLQQDIVEAALQNRDVLALMPTGGGKSICFQVPAIIKDGLCIVVSPLIALIKDQVYQLTKRGIAAEAIYSGISKENSNKILDQAVDGKIKFLYVSPERLQVKSFLERAAYMKISLIAIDEAHCISQWGYDFRPNYTKIAQFRSFAPNANVVALTATATPEVKKDIINQLQLKEPLIFQKSFSRENLAYRVVRTENKFGEILNLLNKYPGTAIIYVNSRKRTLEIAKLLNSYDIKASAYNAGLDAKMRDERQDSWIQGATRVIVATNAFGMGIDKPDVRLVIHLDLPQSLEAYYQEAGRAGRDEKEAVAFLLYEDADEAELMENVEKASMEPKSIKDIYDSICNNYSIAIDALPTERLDFNIEKFCVKHGKKHHEVAKTLNILEQNEIISLNEGFQEKSKIMILVSVADLHKFFKESPQCMPLLQNILRVYGGDVFCSYVKISEDFLANNIAKNVDDVHKMLCYLKKCELISYQPSSVIPQISFLKPRFEKNRLPIDDKLIINLNTTYLKKASAMINYAKQSVVCRVQFLLDYFGEQTFVECTKCDICMSKKVLCIQDDDYIAYKEKLTDFLKVPKTIAETLQFLNFESEDYGVKLLTEMLKMGDLDQVGLNQIIIKT